MATSIQKNMSLKLLDLDDDLLLRILRGNLLAACSVCKTLRCLVQKAPLRLRLQRSRSLNRHKEGEMVEPRLGNLFFLINFSNVTLKIPGNFFRTPERRQSFQSLVRSHLQVSTSCSPSKTSNPPSLRTHLKFLSLVLSHCRFAV